MRTKINKTECKSKKIEFQELGLKNVEASFDGGKISSDAGGLILREIDKAKIFGICPGYEDLNEHDDLSHDPLLAAACDKQDPSGNKRENNRDKGKPLAGKSTLNRLKLSGEGYLSKHRYKKISHEVD